MAILDERLEFVDGLSLSSGTNTGYNNTGDLIDLGTARDIGGGEVMYLVFQVDEAIGGSSSTVSFMLVSDSTTTIATNGAQTIHYASDVIAEADLVAGYTLCVPLPLEAPEYERYLGVQLNVGTAALNAGSFSAFITRDPFSNWKAYAEGDN